MAFLDCAFHSDALGHAVSMKVILPQHATTQIGLDSVASGNGTTKVLYLLHGLSDDHTIWSRRTSIERYAAAYDLAVIMPNGGRSFYTDMAHGEKYFTFFGEELPRIVHDFFRVSDRREDTFIAGLSMGGYGAAKLALSHPERYAAVGMLSAVADINWVCDTARHTQERIAEAFNIFGDDALHLDGTRHDLKTLVNRLLDNPQQPRPRIFQICGTEDALYPDNINFRDFLRKQAAFDYEFHDAPGNHNWEFWDAHIPEVLHWMLAPEA